MRAFIALDLPATTRAQIFTAGEAVRALDRRWAEQKWVSSRNLHVTLKFLGDIDPAGADVLRAELDVALANAACAELAEPRLIAVPDQRRAHMLWVTFLDVGGRCAALAEMVSRAALHVSAPIDDRPFVPHVTLVRSRRPLSAPERTLAAAQHSLKALPGAMSVGAVTLYESVLTRRGPVYEALDVWRLGAR